MQLWPPRWQGAQESVETQRAAVARRAKDVAKADFQGSTVGQGRVRHQTEYTGCRGDMCSMGVIIVEGGKLVGLQSLHSQR